LALLELAHLPISTKDFIGGQTIFDSGLLRVA
jgi:hypothetical protein